MKALKGQIPRPPGDCRRKAQAPYLAYCRGKVERYGSLPADARPWLRKCGLPVLALDRLAVEAETARVELTGSTGRRRRDALRVELRRLERRRGG